MSMRNRAQEYDVGVAAVALFFVLTSVNIVLFVSTVVSEHFKTAYVDVPQLALMVVMLVGLILMIQFIRAPKHRETIDMKDPHARRHNLHTFASLFGIMIFYAQGIILDINHLVAGFDCLPKWTVCDNGYVLRYHIVDLLFHVFRFVFMGFESVVCFLMVFSSLARNASVMLGVAIVQSANIALCFQTIVSESYAHHHHTSLETNFLSTACWSHEQNNSWSDCPHATNDTTQCCWSNDNELLRWLDSSNPSLWPVAVEFALLVGEIMFGFLHKTRHNHGGTADNPRVGDEEHGELVAAAAAGGDVRHDRPSTDEQRMQNNINQEEDATNEAADGGPVEERSCTAHIQQLVAYIRRLSGKKLSMLAVLLAIPFVYDAIFVVVIYFEKVKLGLPVYIGHSDGDEHSGKYYTWYVWGSTCALVSMICVTIVGWHFSSSRPFRHAAAHTSSLDYLPLFASAGSFLLGIKALLQSISHHAGAIHIIKPLLTIVQVFLQVVFMYKVRDVELEVVTPRDKKVHLLIKVVLYYMAGTNILFWSTDSLTLPEHHSDDDASVGWETFDNVLGPFNVFFRFSSALLFFSILLYLSPWALAHLLSSDDDARVNGSNIELEDADVREISAADQPQERRSSS